MERGTGQEGAGASGQTGPSALPPSTVLRVPAELAGLRADAYLFRELPAVSRSRIRQKIQMGESLLNGGRFSTSTRLRSGDVIRVTWRTAPRDEPVSDLAVLFEDDVLLAVDKPAGIASHPMGRHQSGTVVQFARRRFDAAIRESLGRGDVSFYPTLVNRLDVFTSGIVIVAKTADVHRAMQEMTMRRLIRREYVALVEGVIGDREGTIDLPLGPDPASGVRVKMAVRGDGRPSSTRYEVMERLPSCTLVRVRPLTGRQHQIRVHLAALGHPVVGDLLYKDEALFIAAQEPGGRGAAQRHCLHAERAIFIHPLTGAEIRIEAPIPADFQRIVELMRGGSAP